MVKTNSPSSLLPRPSRRRKPPTFLGVTLLESIVGITMLSFLAVYSLEWLGLQLREQEAARAERQLSSLVYLIRNYAAEQEYVVPFQRGKGEMHPDGLMAARWPADFSDLEANHLPDDSEIQNSISLPGTILGSSNIDIIPTRYMGMALLEVKGIPISAQKLAERAAVRLRRNGFPTIVGTNIFENPNGVTLAVVLLPLEDILNPRISGAPAPQLKIESDLTINGQNQTSLYLGTLQAKVVQAHEALLPHTHAPFNFSVKDSDPAYLSIAREFGSTPGDYDAKLLAGMKKLGGYSSFYTDSCASGSNYAPRKVNSKVRYWNDKLDFISASKTLTNPVEVRKCTEVRNWPNPQLTKTIPATGSSLYSRFGLVGWWAQKDEDEAEEFVTQFVDYSLDYSAAGVQRPSSTPAKFSDRPNGYAWQENAGFTGSYTTNAIVTSANLPGVSDTNKGSGNMSMVLDETERLSVLPSEESEARLAWQTNNMATYHHSPQSDYAHHAITWLPMPNEYPAAASTSKLKRNQYLSKIMDLGGGALERCMDETWVDVADDNRHLNSFTRIDTTAPVRENPDYPPTIISGAGTYVQWKIGNYRGCIEATAGHTHNWVDIMYVEEPNKEGNNAYSGSYPRFYVPIRAPILDFADGGLVHSAGGKLHAFQGDSAGCVVWQAHYISVDTPAYWYAVPCLRPEHDSAAVKQAPYDKVVDYSTALDDYYTALDDYNNNPNPIGSPPIKPGYLLGIPSSTRVLPSSYKHTQINQFALSELFYDEGNLGNDPILETPKEGFYLYLNSIESSNPCYAALPYNDGSATTTRQCLPENFNEDFNPQPKAKFLVNNPITAKPRWFHNFRNFSGRANFNAHFFHRRAYLPSHSLTDSEGFYAKIHPQCPVNIGKYASTSINTTTRAIDYGVPYGGARTYPSENHAGMYAGVDTNPSDDYIQHTENGDAYEGFADCKWQYDQGLDPADWERGTCAANAANTSSSDGFRAVRPTLSVGELTGEYEVPSWGQITRGAYYDQDNQKLKEYPHDASQMEIARSLCAGALMAFPLSMTNGIYHLNGAHVYNKGLATSSDRRLKTDILPLNAPAGGLSEMSRGSLQSSYAPALQRLGEEGENQYGVNARSLVVVLWEEVRNRALRQQQELSSLESEIDDLICELATASCSSPQ